MTHCERLKLHLLKHGHKSVRQHQQLGAHAQNCEQCRALLQSWKRIPGLLDQLPEYEPDAALLQLTGNALRDKGGEAAEKTRRLPRLATSLASAAVLLAAIGLSRQLFDPGYPSLSTPAFREEHEISREFAQEVTRGHRSDKLVLSGEHFDSPQGADRSDFYALDLEEGRVSGNIGGSLATPHRVEQSAALNARIDRVGTDEEMDRSSYEAKKSSLKNSIAEPVAQNRPAAESRGTAMGQKSKDGDRLRFNKQESKQTENLAAHALIDGFEDDSIRERDPVNFRFSEANNEVLYRDDISKSRRAGKRELPASPDTADKRFRMFLPERQLKSIAESTLASGAEAGFLGYYQATESLQFQPAQGYWANTYVPGDPNIRLLKARLALWDRSSITQHLEQDVVPVAQPFDAPADNALALSLMSDANAVDGATRMRLQVGIRGIEHRRGQRPAMNMGVVIDLPADVDDATRIAARALLDAMLAAKQPGDHFSLVINGPGGLVVPPDDFRFGPLQLARQAILGNAPPNSAKTLDLAEAIKQAANFVRQSDDPSQPLGSSSILLVSANTLDEVDALSAQIHALARDGTTLSVVPLGNLPDNSQVERLVLAGLGNRRILEAPDQARQLVEAELHSSSRAVARAVRLSIRLAPGVRLIGVVGSRRLDPERSQRVRDIENSMDRRLSANLGIEADRGEDEDGIQIVIPSIFSGDDVTVLVDVLVDRPGDIASVSLRYKDLVYLRNGTLRGQLRLPAGALERGAAEHAVLKNLLAHHFSAATGRAADAVGRQHTSEAAAILTGMRDEIVSLRGRVPAFSNDPELQRDQQILDRYINILASERAHQPELADSLRYAAWAKAHRPLAEWK